MAANERESEIKCDGRNLVQNVDSGIGTASGTLLGDIKLPRGGWLKDPFEDIHFKGKTDKQNPIRFLGRFEKLARYENISETDQLYYFARAMCNTAGLWYELQRPIDTHDAKELFKKQYWGTLAQMRFRQNLYFGKFKHGEPSMSEYALNLARQACTLNPLMADDEIIQTVREHFDGGVSRELRPSVVRNVEQMIEMLDTIENERANKTLKSASKTDNGGTSKQREVGSSAKNKEARSSTGDRKENKAIARRDANDDSSAKKFTPRKLSFSERVPTSTVEITELPKSDDDTTKPKTTIYTRNAYGAKASRDADVKPRYTKDASARKRNVAAIEARKRPSDTSSEEESKSQGCKDAKNGVCCGAR